MAPAGLDAFTSALNDCRLISSAAAAITKQHFHFFFFFFLCAAPSQKSSVILCSLRNWMYRRHSEKHAVTPVICAPVTLIPSPLMFIRRHHHLNQIFSPIWLFLYGFHSYVNVMIWSRKCERMPFRAFCHFGSYTLAPLLFLSELQYFRYSFTQFKPSNSSQRIHLRAHIVSCAT